jgi:hypothetical protein
MTIRHRARSKPTIASTASGFVNATHHLQNHQIAKAIAAPLRAPKVILKMLMITRMTLAYASGIPN